MADENEDNGALHSSSDASHSQLQGIAPMRAAYLTDAQYKRSLLVKYYKKWRAFHRKRRAQWKQQLLATHHAHYARLWSAFNVWRQRTSKARKRKQQIEAACAIGAGFFQRLFFQRWRAYVAQQRTKRRQAALSPLPKRVATYRTLFDMNAQFVMVWKALLRESAKKKHSLANQKRLGRVAARLPFSRQLHVQGSAIHRPAPRSVPILKLQHALCEPPASTAAIQGKATALRRLIESRCMQHFFKVWRSSVSSVRRELEKKAVVAAKILHFQFRQVVSRWKRRMVFARERSLLEKRAYFFLYFCLTKKSLIQLERNAQLRKREHLVAGATERGIKMRALRKLMVLSNQRRSVRRVFVAWQSYTIARQKKEKPELQLTKLLVYNKYRSRLLREAFRSWRDRFLQKQVYASVIRVVQQYRVGAVRLAWRRWQEHVIQASKIQQWEGNRRARTLHRVWGAWKLRTHRARRKELNRRLAVRFGYKHLLRKGFASFLNAASQSQELAESAETMRNERSKRVLVNCFVGWKTLTAHKKLRARKHADAAHVYERRLLNRIWELGWRRFVSLTTLKRTKLENATKHNDARLQQKAFQGWKKEWADQQKRDELLGVKATNFLETSNHQRKERVFQSWLEYVRKRQTSRLVSAHPRGTWQVQVLRRSFSDWMARISELRWKQIQDQRACQHRDAKLKQKCFQFWKRKLAALKNFRAQNRKALIHWKLSVEKKAFGGLKAYVARKKHNSARMHDALEFRHRLIVSDGVRHWMTASLHLQAQRENHASQSQAQHAARVWRTVARIARHWRALAVNRRAIRLDGIHVKAPANYGMVNAWRSPDSWLGGHDRKWIGQHRAPPIRIGKENRDVQNIFCVNSTDPVAATSRSALSEYVTLPKNRPQPRRPIDLLVGNAFDDLQENLPPEATTTGTAAYNVKADDLHTKYGFEFPAQPFQPLDTRSPIRIHQISREGEMRAPLKKTEADEPQVRPRPTQQSPLSQLDALEAQLQVWRTRKLDMKALQVKIENYKRQLQDFSHLSPSTARQMQIELSTMEKQYDEFSHKWLVSKGRIQMISQEILRLHAALQKA